MQHGTFTVHAWLELLKFYLFKYMYLSLPFLAFSLSSSFPSSLPSSLPPFLSLLFTCRCYLKLGDWQAELNPDTLSLTTSFSSILQYYELATKFDRQWYKAWHAWAFMNFQALLHQRQEQQKLQKSNSNLAASSIEEVNSESATKTDMTASIQYSSNAVHGFFRSISLSSGNSLQDTLRYFGTV